MVVLLCPHIEFLGGHPVQVLDFSQLSFVVYDQIFALTFTNSEQIDFFGQQVCFILLFGGQSVMGCLYQFDLFIDQLELALKLFLGRPQRGSLLCRLLAKGLSRAEL